VARNRRPDVEGSGTPEAAAGHSRRVVSVNVGRARDWPWEHRVVRTAFLKVPQAGPVGLGAGGFAGDECADRSVHGGPTKTVYAYPSEHYAFWRRELGVRRLPWGSFGENLTTAGLLEGDVAPGDRLATPTATLAVTRPRFPCVKLNVRFGRPEMMERFLAAERSGFYLSVVRPGSVGAGDPIDLQRGARPADSIAEIYRRRNASERGVGSSGLRA